MRGISVQKGKLVSDDNRRSILEVMNGQMAVRNLKFIRVKDNPDKECVVLAGHYHTYPEFRYMVSGTATFRFRDMITAQEETVDVSEGDVVFADGYIHHVGTISAGAVILEGATEMYFDPNYNDHPVDFSNCGEKGGTRCS